MDLWPNFPCHFLTFFVGIIRIKPPKRVFCGWTLLGEKEQFWWSVFLWWRCMVQDSIEQQHSSLETNPWFKQAQESLYTSNICIKKGYTVIHMYIKSCITSKQTTISTIPFSCFGYLFSEIHMCLRCLWWCLPGGRSGCNRDNSRDYELYWLQFGWEPQKTSSFFFLIFLFGSVFLIGTFF